MSDVMAEGAGKPKNLFQKLINKESLPLLFSIFAAFNWASGVVGVSALALAIYQKFDDYLKIVATYFANLVNLWLGTFSLLTVDALFATRFFLYIGVICFAITGIVASAKKKSSVQNFKEFALTISATILISIFAILKSGMVLRDSSVHVFFTEGSLYLLLPAFAQGVFSLALYAYLTSRNKQTKITNYYLAVILSYPIAPIGVGLCGWHTQGYFDFAVVALTSITFLPLLLLSFNPKRIRQIGLIALIFIGLILLSIPLHAGLPSLIGEFSNQGLKS